MVYKRKDLMSSDSLGEKSFLASEENGLIVLNWQEDLNNDLFHFFVFRIASLNLQNIK